MNKEISKRRIIKTKEFLRNMFYILIGVFSTYFFINKSPVTYSTKFDDLLSIIESNYVDTIDYKKIENNAVNNLLATLDPHSIYIPAEEFLKTNETLVGNFEGIGIEFQIINDTIFIVSPLPGGPSDIVGIKSGDKIIKINDTLVAGVKVNNNNIYTKLRGKKGTTVKLSISRSNNNNNNLLNFIIKRNTIEIKSVEKGLLLSDSVGFIKINTFGDKTYSDFYKELNDLIRKNSINSLVIDLRQNSGGYLETAVSILDELIADEHVLVSTKGKHYKTEKFLSKKKGIFENGQVVVLIDESSASASEILAGAIQDLDRGYVIGRRSYGKGLVQNQIPLRDGSVVRLTVAKYYTPSGRNIQKPYNLNHENYDNEIYSRYTSGELFDEIKQTTNDTTKYYTLIKKRNVKAGGGIYPDYYIPIDTNYDYSNFTILRQFISEFVLSNNNMFENIKIKYKDISSFNKSYNVDNMLLKKYYIFVNNQKVKYNLLKKSTFETKLKQSLKAYIAKQIYGNEGYLVVLNASDKSIQKSLEIIKKNK